MLIGSLENPLVIRNSGVLRLVDIERLKGGDKLEFGEEGYWGSVEVIEEDQTQRASAY